MLSTSAVLSKGGGRGGVEGEGEGRAPPCWDGSWLATVLRWEETPGALLLAPGYASVCEGRSAVLSQQNDRTV